MELKQQRVMLYMFLIKPSRTSKITKIFYYISYKFFILTWSKSADNNDTFTVPRLLLSLSADQDRLIWCDSIDKPWNQQIIKPSFLV